MEHLVENGTVAGKFLENDILRYECDPTYRLVGDKVISCGSDGEWNGTTDAHCELSKSSLLHENDSHVVLLQRAKGIIIHLSGAACVLELSNFFNSCTDYIEATLSCMPDGTPEDSPWTPHRRPTEPDSVSPG